MVGSRWQLRRNQSELAQRVRGEHAGSNELLARRGRLTGHGCVVGADSRVQAADSEVPLERAVRRARHGFAGLAAAGKVGLEDLPSTLGIAHNGWTGQRAVEVADDTEAESKRHIEIAAKG